MEITKQTINDIKPKFFVGKNKINKNFIEEIKRHLEKNEIVKIKFNGFLKKDFEEEIKKFKDNSNFEILKKIGFVIVLKLSKN